MGAMTLFYAPLRGIQDALSQIVEIDTQMTELDRVSNGQINMNKALEDSINLANELGVKINELNSAMINYARQGFRGEDLNRMTEYATLLSNISELSAEESASALTAAVKGFSLEASQALTVVNQLNEIDNNFSVSSKILAESLMKSAGAAKTYGVSMENALGYTVAIGQVSRESGSIIGNSLKSIYSRITSVQPAIDSLAEIGINVKEASGEMRSVDNILGDLSVQWQGLSNAQKQNLGLQIAG
jgi:TP901 family phage tail tape measure protein